MERDPETHVFADEWIQFLNELRIVLPGVQLLFAFLLSAPFSSRFQLVGPLVRGVYFLCFLCTTGATAFLVAPSVYHRLHWRRDVKDKEQMIVTSNRLAIIGVILLAMAMTCAVFVVSSVIYDHALAWAMTVSALALFGMLWFVLPLLRRRRERLQS